MTPEQIVQKQLEAYNVRNLQDFMDLMADDVQVYGYGKPKAISDGKKSVEALYKNLFDKSPDLNSVLENRIVIGDNVIDHERITGRMGNHEVIELVVIFETKHNQISRMTVIKK